MKNLCFISYSRARVSEESVFHQLLKSITDCKRTYHESTMSAVEEAGKTENLKQ